MPAIPRLVFLLLMSITTAAGAQHAPHRIAGPTASEVLGVAARGPLRQSLAVDSVRREIRPTQWKKGALIGGLAAGLGFVVLMDRVCRGSDTGCGGSVTPHAFLAGGVLGGLVGALIGAQVPKAEAQ